MWAVPGVGSDNHRSLLKYASHQKSHHKHFSIQIEMQFGDVCRLIGSVKGRGGTDTDLGIAITENSNLRDSDRIEIRCSIQGTKP